MTVNRISIIILIWSYNKGILIVIKYYKLLSINLISKDKENFKIEIKKLNNDIRDLSVNTKTIESYVSNIKSLQILNIYIS